MKKTCERYAEKAIGWIGSALISFFMVWYYMSNRRKHRKFPTSKNTTTVISAKPSKKRMVKAPQTKVNILNCFPPHTFKVTATPKDWPKPRPFVYVDRIGKCVGTDRLYGARLTFDTGETVSIPFDCLEATETTKMNQAKKPEKQDGRPVVAQEVELVKGQYYKLIKKPTAYNTTCKYVGEIGKCILVDDRGARLRFSDGNDISFQADLLEVAPAIDLSNVIPPSDLDEDDIVIGASYVVVKSPEKFGEGHKLVGMVGKAKWPNWRGVCLKFPDKSSYVIPYDCIQKYVEPAVPNPVPETHTLTATSIVIGRKYKVSSVPGDWKEAEKRYAIGQFATVLGATDLQKVAKVRFDNKLEKVIPLNCLVDLPRPTEDELIALIRANPLPLLHIIKQINAVTRLRPVKDFCSAGILPYCEDEKVTHYENGKPVINEPIYGPHLPAQHSAALLMNTTTPDLTDEALSRIATMFDAEDAVNAAKVTPKPAPVSDVCAED